MWDKHGGGAGPHPASVVGLHQRGLGGGASLGHHSGRRRRATCIWGKTLRYKAQANRSEICLQGSDLRAVPVSNARETIFKSTMSHWFSKFLLASSCFRMPCGFHCAVPRAASPCASPLAMDFLPARSPQAPSRLPSAHKSPLQYLLVCMC